MALSDNPNFLVGVVYLNTIAAVLLLLLLIYYPISWYLYERTIKKLYTAKSSVVRILGNTLTIFSILGYFLNASFSILSLLFGFMILTSGCKFYVSITAFFHIFGNTSKHLIFLFRLFSTFKGTIYAYRMRSIVIIVTSSISLSVILFVIIVIFWETVYSVSEYDMHSIQYTFHICSTTGSVLPRAMQSFYLLYDVVFSCVIAYLFLRHIYQIVVKANNDDKPPQSSPRFSTRSRSTSVSHSTFEENPKEKKYVTQLKRLIFKYSVTTFVSAFSTLVATVVVVLAKTTKPFVVDNVVNAWCLALMCTWNNKLFDRLCCVCMPVTKFLFANANTKTISRMIRSRSLHSMRRKRSERCDLPDMAQLPETERCDTMPEMTAVITDRSEMPEMPEMTVITEREKSERCDLAPVSVVTERDKFACVSKMEVSAQSPSEFHDDF